VRGGKYRCIDVEGEIMGNIEEACGKKTRRVDAKSVYWKVGQQEKGSGNRTTSQWDRGE
jgi:hypothetical protein